MAKISSDISRAKNFKINKYVVKLNIYKFSTRDYTAKKIDKIISPIEGKQHTDVAKMIPRKKNNRGGNYWCKNCNVRENTNSPEEHAKIAKQK